MVRQKFDGWKVAVGCFLFLFFGVAISGNAAGIFMNPICEDLNFKTTEFSILYMCSSGASALVLAVLVPKIHRGNMKLQLIVAAAAMTGGYTLYGVCRELWQFYLSAALMGSGLAYLMQVPVGMMITNWFRDKRSLVMSIVMMAGGLGGAVWSVVLSTVIEHEGWRKAYFLGGIVSFIALLLIILCLLKRSPQEYGQEPYTCTHSLDKRKDKGKTAGQLTDEWMGLDKKTASRTLAYRLYGLRQLLTGIFASGVSVHVINYLVHDGWKYLEASKVFASYQAVSIVGMLIGGTVLQRVGLKRGIGIFGSQMIISCLALALCTRVPGLAWVYAVTGGLCGAMISVLPLLLPTAVFGTQDYTAIYSYGYVNYMIGCMASSYLVSLLAGAGGYSLAFGVCAGLCVVIVISDLAVLSMGMRMRKKLALEGGHDAGTV